MRSHFRLHATCALKERRIEVVRVFPIYFMQIIFPLPQFHSLHNRTCLPVFLYRCLLRSTPAVGLRLGQQIFQRGSCKGTKAKTDNNTPDTVTIVSSTFPCVFSFLM